MYNILHLASGPGPADARRRPATPPLPEPRPGARPAPVVDLPVARPQDQLQPDPPARAAMDCP